LPANLLAGSAFAMAMKLFHVSDVHFGAEDPKALDWFARCVADEAPDAVIMTGDLTMRARPSEFDAGGKWLQSLGVPVTIEVGNHDLPYIGIRCAACSARTSDTVRQRA